MFTEIECPESINTNAISLPEEPFIRNGLGRNRPPMQEEQKISLPGEAAAIRNNDLENGLIQSAQQGDLSSFNRLIEIHQDSLYGWVFSLVNDEALAEDITQSTFITAYEKLATFRGGSFRSWIFKIARNRSFDELRRRKRHPSLRLDDSAEDERDRMESLPDNALLPEDAFLVSERSASIEKILKRLPDIFQQVLRLVDLEGLDYQEAADILSLPLGTVKSRLTRARLKMRHLLQEMKWM